LCQNDCPNSSTNAWLLVNSRTLGKLPTSHQFLKFIAQVPHLIMDQSLFYQYYRSYLKKFSITQSTSVWLNTIKNDKRQFGFKEKHSTVITTIYEELFNNSDNKSLTCSLFLDLSQAFHCCDREILLDKLFGYGMKGVSHKLFSIHLHNRMQCTKLDLLNLHTKWYLVGPLKAVSSRLYFFLFTLMISIKLPLFILLYLLVILSFICPPLVLMFFRQLSTLNYVKFTTGSESTNFLLIITKRLTSCY